MGSIYKKVGNNIRKLRKRQNMSQETLAEAAKIDPKSIIQIEAGNRNPTIKTIRKIALALKVKPSELLE